MSLYGLDNGRRGECCLPPRFLRVTHWNLEGILSKVHGNKLEDSEFLNTIYDEDVIALTETHTSEEVWESGLLRIPGYVIKRKVRPRSRKAKSYSGGIAVAIKEELINNIQVLNSSSENILWVRFKLKNGSKDFLLGIVYISPIDSTYSKNVLVNQFRTWEILTEELAKFKSYYNVGLIGDFNARTGTHHDIVVNDDDHFVHLPADYLTDSELISRQNCDCVVNTFGRKLLELCRMAGLRIVNGRKFGDSIGKRTCHEWNGSSTVDYMVTDLNTFGLIHLFRVRDNLDHISDHCPISAVINLDVPRNYACGETSRMFEKAPSKIRWDKTVEEIFRRKLGSEDSHDILGGICKLKMNDGEQIEQGLLEINSLLSSAAGIKLGKRNISRVAKKKQCKA